MNINISKNCTLLHTTVRTSLMVHSSNIFCGLNSLKKYKIIYRTVTGMKYSDVYIVIILYCK